MITLRLTLLVLLTTLLGTQASAHGLNKVGDKAVLFKQHGNLLIKAEMTPNSVNFNKANSLYISVIDQQAGRFYQGEINASMSSADATSGAGTDAMLFTKGVYKTKLHLPEGGAYQLKLDFNGKNGLTPVVLDFQLNDNRLFARNAIFFTLSGIFIAVIIFLSVFYLKRKQSINSNVGRRLTCDI